MSVRRLVITVALFWVMALPLAFAPAPVRSQERSLAILVVGDAGGEVLLQREKEMFRLLAALRAKAGLTKADLPIISYHFDKPVERSYCEKGLKIKRSDLLFVGLVEHEKRVPRKVVYRIHNVVDVAAVADKVMAEVVTRLGIDPALILPSSPQTTLPSPQPSATPTPSPSPPARASPTPGAARDASPVAWRTASPTPTPPAASPSPTPQAASPTPTAVLVPYGHATRRPTPRPTPTPRVDGLTVLRLVSVDYLGTAQIKFKAGERGIYVNAFIRNDNPSKSHAHTLLVRLVDRAGTSYGRTMGGAFTVAAGERIDRVDMVRRADPDRHNGYLLKGNALGEKPGHYQIILEIDGITAARAELEIVAGE